MTDVHQARAVAPLAWLDGRGYRLSEGALVWYDAEDTATSRSVVPIEPFAVHHERLAALFLDRTDDQIRQWAAGEGRAADLGPRMPTIGVLEMGRRDVRVDLGGPEILVAEHRLDCSQIGSLRDQMGRERMPKRVGRQPLRDPGSERVLRNDLPEPLPRHRCVAIREEQGRARALDTTATAHLEVLAKDPERSVADRHEPWKRGSWASLGGRRGYQNALSRPMTRRD
jgi:hypothetical protein